MGAFGATGIAPLNNTGLGCKTGVFAGGMAAWGVTTGDGGATGVADDAGGGGGATGVADDAEVLAPFWPP